MCLPHSLTTPTSRSWDFALCVCESTHIHTCAKARVRRTEANFQNWFYPFTMLLLGHQTQVIRLGGKCSYPENHLPGPGNSFDRVLKPAWAHSFGGVCFLLTSLLLFKFFIVISKFLRILCISIFPFPISSFSHVILLYSLKHMTASSLLLLNILYWVFELELS